jgi:hypothetical protein
MIRPISGGTSEKLKKLLQNCNDHKEYKPANINFLIIYKYNSTRCQIL